MLVGSARVGQPWLGHLNGRSGEHVDPALIEPDCTILAAMEPMVLSSTAEQSLATFVRAADRQRSKRTDRDASTTKLQTE